MNPYGMFIKEKGIFMVSNTEQEVSPWFYNRNG